MFRILMPLVAVAAALTVAGCGVPAECCCCYYTAAPDGTCDSFTSEQIGSTANSPCGTPDTWPDDPTIFSCFSSESSMSVASQFEADARQCLADL